MGLLHTATFSGFENLAKSFGKSAGSSASGALGREASLMGKAAKLCAAPLLVPLNLLAHGAALTVNSYRGAFRKAPGLTALGTAAVAIPTALLVMSERKDKANSASLQAMQEVDHAQAQTGQMLDLLQATEPSMRPAATSDVPTQVNSAVYEGAPFSQRPAQGIGA